MSEAFPPARPSPAIVLEYATPRLSRPLPLWIDTLGWAGYLGCSWTWCIGMFLPVLLIRQYGLSAWWAFAIPNVVGAAAMGWVVRNGNHSQAMVNAHRPAIRAFSYVTIAFHAFFFSLIALELGVAPAAIPVCVALICFLWARVTGRIFPNIVMALSLLLAAAAVATQTVPLVAARDLAKRPVPLLDFVALAAVMVFGFLLCPYLDQTFHRARQASDACHPRWTFAIGFGGFFTAMIVFTLGYSGWIWTLPGTGRWMQWSEGGIALILLLHFSTQAIATMSLHWPDTTRPEKSRLAAGTVFAGAMALTLGFTAANGWLSHFSLETIYRLFLAPYALVFPAYVLICMKPWRLHPTSPTARQWTFFALAVVVASPMYWSAFIDNKMFWLLPALGWIGLMWVFASRREDPESNSLITEGLPGQPDS